MPQMTSIRHLPNTIQRVSNVSYGVPGNTIGDAVFKYNSDNTAVDNEDVPLLGNYTDEAHDVTTEVEVPNALLRGTPNKLAGTTAAIDGAELSNLTIRGNDADTTRTRFRLAYIDFSECD